MKWMQVDKNTFFFNNNNVNIYKLKNLNLKLYINVIDII